jgi:hypothetical protein
MYGVPTLKCSHASAGVFKAFLLYTERHGNSTDVSALLYEDLNY